MRETECQSSHQTTTSLLRGLPWVVVALVLVLAVMFRRSLDPSQILFSSDGPLGANQADFAAMPEAFKGIWLDLNWLGLNVGAAFPTLTYLLLWLLKPVAFARFYAPITLFILGLSVWILLRRLGLRNSVSVAGAIAAALNSDFFSYACWGLGTLPLTVAFAALSLAALVGKQKLHPFVHAALAGVPLGIAVMEGFDSGAIFSLYVGAFVIFQGLFVYDRGDQFKQWVNSAIRLGLVSLLAAFTAFEAVSVLIKTQVKGVVGMEQDTRTKRQRWNEATQWSLPKKEALRIIIPGLFGYRMDTPGGGAYWGGVGRDPAWDEYFRSPDPARAKRPDGRLLRHSGAGFYGGVMVVLLAIGAVVQISSRSSGIFNLEERRTILFWFVATIVSLLLAFGRHAPFYKIIYALPYFSTIRNPIKFLHPFSLALVILSAYGLEGIYRTVSAQSKPVATSILDRIRIWWRARDNPYRSYLGVCSAAVGVTFCLWLIYAARQQELVKHLQQVGFPDVNVATAIANHSINEVGLFGFLLGISVLWLTCVLAGVFDGHKLRWAITGTILLIALDMIRANVPWVVYWNRHEKYASNKLFDILRQRPFEYRLAVFPFPVNTQMELLQQVYHAEWLQHGLRYYNIQCLDSVQEPRMAIENFLFRTTFYAAGAHGHVRLWELTNTRFLLGLAGNFVDVLNEQFDPDLRRFRLHTAFELTQEAGGSIGAQTNLIGPFALVEFTGALPRAAIYFDWEISTNDQATLRTLVSREFDPRKKVIICSPAYVPPLATVSAATDSPNATASVEFVSYSPKDIVLRTRSSAAGILLLNDKHDPNWTVTVDDKSAELLRCNYLMRGVAVPQGEHLIRFRFSLPLTPLLISVGGITIGAALLCLLFVVPGTGKSKDKTDEHTNSYGNRH